MEECDLKVWNVFDQFGTIPCSARYFLGVGAPMGLLEVKNSENLDFQVVFLKKKDGGVQPKSFKWWDHYTLFSYENYWGMVMPCSDIFLHFL